MFLLSSSCRSAILHIVLKCVWISCVSYTALSRRDTTNFFFPTDKSESPPKLEYTWEKEKKRERKTPGEPGCFEGFLFVCQVCENRVRSCNINRVYVKATRKDVLCLPSIVSLHSHTILFSKPRVAPRKAVGVWNFSTTAVNAWQDCRTPRHFGFLPTHPCRHVCLWSPLPSRRYSCICSGDCPLLEADFCIHLILDNEVHEAMQTWETPGMRCCILETKKTKTRSIEVFRTIVKIRLALRF